VDPVPDPVLFFLVVPGIEPGPPVDHRGGHVANVKEEMLSTLDVDDDHDVNLGNGK
jgi:hypothetical protein